MRDGTPLGEEVCMLERAYYVTPSISLSLGKGELDERRETVQQIGR